jgi:hypothetical protein
MSALAMAMQVEELRGFIRQLRSLKVVSLDERWCRDADQTIASFEAKIAALSVVPSEHDPEPRR